MIRRIVSGGQTGADRAALDVAVELGIACGGWVPRGRLAEDGAIPEAYPNLVEAHDAQPNTRSALNVEHSDATLIISHGALFGGSEFTASTAMQAGKPWLHIDLARLSIPEAVRNVARWLAATRPATLNVVGAKSSDDPLIYSKTKRVLEAILMDIAAAHADPVRGGDLLAIALARRDAAFANFRHWDQVRWLVPYWYCVLATAGGGVIAYIAKPENETLLRIVAGGLGIFGILCLKLVWNLSKYHNAALRSYGEFLNELTLDAPIKAALQDDLPFALKGKAFLSSAACWFFIFIILLTLGFGSTAVCGVWW